MWPSIPHGAGLGERQRPKGRNSLKSKDKAQEEIYNLNIPIPIKQIEIIVFFLNYPTHKTPGTDNITGKFYIALIEEIVLILYKHFQNPERKENFPIDIMKPALLWY